MRHLVFGIVFMMAVGSCAGSIITVDDDGPADFNNIQAGIDAAVNGDIVIVSPGTYYENIDFDGNSITLRSTDPNDPNIVAATVIDANGSGTVVTFGDVENAECVLAGFTITGGKASMQTNWRAGGIRCRNGTITINNCVITSNSAGQGAGIFKDRGELTLAGCTFSGNVADCDGGGVLNESGGLMLTDCTFSENAAIGCEGGGIRSLLAEMTLTGCTFSGNSTGVDGGGICTDYNSVTLINCRFSGNSAGHWGGGMYNSHLPAVVTNCTFSENSATHGGGLSSFLVYEGTMTLTNCTFSGNSADDYGGAIHNAYGTDLMLTNCLFWGNIANEGPQIAFEGQGTVSISYSCLQGGLWDFYAPWATVNWLTGNIDADPCFADAGSGDCHLRSAAGRWDPNLKQWVIDAGTSRCIDAGNPGSGLGDETNDVNNLRINMGAYGGMVEASTPPYGWTLLGDITNNGIVNGSDFAHQATDWLINGTEQPGDLSRNGIVDTNDVGLLVDDWLKTTSWYE